MARMVDQAGVGRIAMLLAGTIAFTPAMPARADVIAINPDGSTSLRAGAGAVRWSGGLPAADLADDAPDATIPDDVAVPTGALPVPVRAVPAAYGEVVRRLATRYDLSPALIEALVWQESRWQPGAVSHAGALGLAQLMPATARTLGVDPRDPLANLEGGARFLRAQLDLFDGDVEKALAAYNAGPARVLKAQGVPAIPETRAYVAAIIDRLAPTPPGE